MTRRTLPIAAALLLLFPTDAHAYLDPGTGSLLIQGLLAAVFAGAYTLRTYWGRFKALFAQKPTQDEQVVEQEQEQEQEQPLA